jgi:PTS system mannose-specific IIC component
MPPINVSDVLTISLIGGLLSLDSIAVFQGMLSQPIVAATLIGFLLDDTGTGLMIGMLFQLLWMSNVPAGAVVPPDNSVLACICSGTAILGSAFWNPSIAIMFSLIITLIFAPVTAWTDMWVRQFNNRLVASAEASVLQGHFQAIPLKHLTGVFIFFLKGFILILIGTILILLIEKGLSQINIEVPFLTSGYIIKVADLFNTLFITIGIGSAAQLVRGSGGLKSFFVAAFLAMLLAEGMKLPLGISLLLAVLASLIKVKSRGRGTESEVQKDQGARTPDSRF